MGSSLTIPTAAANGIAAGRASAFAKGDAQDGTRHEKRREIGQAQAQGRSVERQSQRVDHLGIEG